MNKALYIKIYEDLKNEIKSNSILPGDTIPSESQLRDIYKCSRDTVRKATLLLEQKNYIKKSRGKSSIVLENRQYLFPTTTLESFKELAIQNNLDYETNVASFKILDKSDIEDIEDIKSDKVIELKRVRMINNDAIVLDIDYLDTNIITGLTQEIAQDSIYEYFEDILGLHISYSKKTVTVENVSPQDLELLHVTEDDLVVMVKSSTYLDSGECFQYSISRHRSDKFIFTSYASR